MAKTYGRYPNVIYEIWNEPAKGQEWNWDIKPYHEAVIPRIRAQDPDNLIICGTPNWSQDVDEASLDPLKFKNVAYTLHFYASTHTQLLRDKATVALNNGVALMVTEWGDSEASGNGYLDAGETRRWLDFLDQNRISWCNWSVSDKRETSSALRFGAGTNGGWTTNDLSGSGILVRDELRSKNRARPAPN
jgi:endoglucanase